jgi:glucose-6-phosphate isomerase
VIAKNHISKNIFNKKTTKKLKEDFNKIFNQILADITTSGKTLNVLNKDFIFNFKQEDLNKFRKFKSIAVIGMGGSILGTEAIHNFLREKIKKKVYFFNDLNIENITNFKKKENLDKTLILIISKSGNTIETISNAFLLETIKKKSKNVIIISEQKSNFLYNLSRKNNLFYIEHKNYIGGRYSVLSEVGMVPTYLMDLNAKKLRANTLKYLRGKNKKFLQESTIKLSKLLTLNKINNIVFLNYFPKLEKFLFWCQQLIAESLGKRGKGFFPIVSNVPKDHHSLLQLYLDGPKDKIFYIFSHNDIFKEKINISRFTNEKSLLNKKKINEVKNAQKKALIEVLKLKKIPFREFEINKINEQALGELFSYFMLETVIIGKLSRINPFDQPAVEQIKDYTKKFLS